MQRTPFLFSIQVGDLAKTKLLIEAGADILAVGHCGKTPLGYAIEQDNVAMLEWLLEHGFDPEQENAFGETPFSKLWNGVRPMFEKTDRLRR